MLRGQPAERLVRQDPEHAILLRLDRGRAGTAVDSGHLAEHLIRSKDCEENPPALRGRVEHDPDLSRGYEINLGAFFTGNQDLLSRRDRTPRAAAGQLLEHSRRDIFKDLETPEN